MKAIRLIGLFLAGFFAALHAALLTGAHVSTLGREGDIVPLGMAVLYALAMAVWEFAEARETET